MYSGDWMLKKERHYNDSDVEIGDSSVEEDCDLLLATAEKDGITEYIDGQPTTRKDDHIGG